MKTAVILDKDVFFRDFQAYLLTKQGYNVVTPERSEDYSHEWVLKQNPSLVITDVILPGGNGFDLIRKLRETPGSWFPIIVYTVLSVEARAIGAGADRFLQKPIIRDAYLSVIRDLTKDRSEEPLHGTPSN